jgi:hypothetical protein
MDEGTTTIRGAAWIRACVVGAASVLVAAVGHGGLGHVPWFAAVACFVGIAAYVGLFGEGRMSTPMLALAMALAQGMLHVAFLLATPGVSHHHGAHAHAMQSHASSSVTMLLVHIAAFLVGVLLVLGVERALWRAVTEAVRAVVSIFRAVLRRLARPALAPAARISTVATSVAQSWLTRAVTRRGPPSVVLAG